MCFGTYEDDIMEGAGAEWISCACGRWLHEDCAENRVIDSSGCERFCPYCVCYVVCWSCTCTSSFSHFYCFFITCATWNAAYI